MPVLNPEIRYSDRLNKVINFTHANNQLNIQLDQLADIACLSRYHFVRVFHDQVGESPVSFLKRTRLERAASMLICKPDTSIKQVASNCGFTSNQLFSRKFGNWFGSCPSEFRVRHLKSKEDKMSQHQLTLGNLIRTELNLENDIHKAAEKVNILELPPTCVAYVRSIGGYGECDNVDQAVCKVKDWARSKSIWNKDSSLIGVSWDFPSITPNDKCRFDACLTLPQGYADTSGISQQIIPGGFYATTRICCQDAHELLVYWEWFLQVVGKANKFKNFNADFIIGPWFESHKQTSEGGEHFVELYTRLELANAKPN